MSEKDDQRPPEPPEPPDDSEAPAKPVAGAPGDPGADTPDSEAREKAEAAAKAKAEAAAKAKAVAEAKAAAEAAKPPWERMPETPESIDASEDALVQSLSSELPGAIEDATLTSGDLALEVRGDAIQGLAKRLKQEHGFGLLVDVCGVHYPQREEAPFEVVYHVFNLETNRRVRLKVSAADGEEVPSVSSIWRGAEWCEREAYDMYGVRFSDHPDLTRILLWEGFNGHPLRKDFPVEGIDTGAAIYPEYYEGEAGPVAGTGTGWKPPEPPASVVEESGGSEESEGSEEGGVG
ncbi:MAG: NADH-quinone oxidoreductase subunit C [Acidobacteriota bacterium]|nr:NADH-quinone oxidoreductase subunit C [Acidobacteriota bacterium]